MQNVVQLGRTSDCFAGMLRIFSLSLSLCVCGVCLCDCLYWTTRLVIIAGAVGWIHDFSCETNTDNLFSGRKPARKRKVLSERQISGIRTLNTVVKGKNNIFVPWKLLHFATPCFGIDICEFTSALMSHLPWQHNLRPCFQFCDSEDVPRKITWKAWYIARLIPQNEKSLLKHELLSEASLFQGL